MDAFVLLIVAFFVFFVLNEGPSLVRKWRKAFDLPDAAGTAELTKLREEVDRLSSEVARLSEEQSFMLRLLDGGERRLVEANHEPDEPR